LKNRQSDYSSDIKSDGVKNEALLKRRRILKIVKEIARALVEYTKNKKKFTSDGYKHFELKPYQKIKIEDLLQIFVDDLELVKEFLQFVIEDLGDKFAPELEQLTTINLYHRLLEYYLYSR